MLENIFLIVCHLQVPQFFEQIQQHVNAHTQKSIHQCTKAVINIKYTLCLHYHFENCNRTLQNLL